MSQLSYLRSVDFTPKIDAPNVGSICSLTYASFKGLLTQVAPRHIHHENREEVQMNDCLAVGASAISMKCHSQQTGIISMNGTDGSL